MYFDFEGSHLETPTIESAVSWRESVLVSVFLHLLVIALVLVVPELPSSRAAVERRAAQLAELVEQRRGELEQQRDRDRFVFVQPRVDIEALEAPEDADASDKDRVAASPERAETPTNELPFALGNSLERVEAERPSDGFGELTQPEPDIGLQARLDEPDGSAEDAEAGGDEDNEFVDGLRFGSGPTPTFNAGDGEPETAATLLGRALRNLEQYVQRESFHNPEGGCRPVRAMDPVRHEGGRVRALDPPVRRTDQAELAGSLRLYVNAWARGHHLLCAQGRYGL